MKNLPKASSMLFAALFFSIAAINRMPQLVVIAVIVTGAVYFISKEIARPMRAPVATIFLAAFFLELLLSLHMYSETLNTKYYGFSYKGDDYVYGDFGTIVGDLWRRGIFPDLERLQYYNLIGENVPVDSYQLYNALIFYLFGTCGGQMVLMINCLLHAAIIIPVYYLCKNLGIEDAPAVFTMSIFAFWPSTFYWAAFNFKEPMILFSLFTIFSLLIALERRASIIKVLLLAASLFMIWLVRRYVFFGLIFMLFFYLFIFYTWPYKRLTILAGVVILIFVQLSFRPLPSDLYAYLELIPARLFAIRYVGAASNTSYLTGLVTTTYPRTLLFLPIGVLATLFLPFLWKISSLAQIWTNIESMLWWSLMPFLVGGIWSAVRDHLKKSFPLVFIFFYWLITLALTEGSMGTLIRHKAILYYTGFIFIAIGIQEALSAIRRPDNGG